jgi:hypothetical protein
MLPVGNQCHLDRASQVQIPQSLLPCQGRLVCLELSPEAAVWMSLPPCGLYRGCSLLQLQALLGHEIRYDGRRGARHASVAVHVDGALLPRFVDEIVCLGKVLGNVIVGHVVCTDDEVLEIFGLVRLWISAILPGKDKKGGGGGKSVFGVHSPWREGRTSQNHGVAVQEEGRDDTCMMLR